MDNHRIKGKEYLNGKLEFEGDYLFDKKFNGKGYDENGNIKYELINGDGKAIIYYEDSLRFEGEFLKGRRNGKGKLYRNDIYLNLNIKMVSQMEKLNYMIIKEIYYMKENLEMV